MAGGQFSLANLFGITLRESANDGSDFTNPDADYRRVFLGEDGELHKKDSAGAVTGFAGSGMSNPMTTQGDSIYGGASGAPTRLAVGTARQIYRVNAGATAPEWATGNLLVDHAHASRTAGSYTLNNTSWTDLDTGLDLVLSAASGDTVEIGLSGLWSGTGANAGCLDVVTMVGGSPVNYLSGGGGASDQGVSAWAAIASTVSPIGGTIHYTLQAGDISGGTVTLRLRFRTSSASNKSLAGTTVNPLQWFAKNIGPAL